MKSKLLLLALVITTILSSCNKDDDKDKFNYPLETLHGIWEGTEIFLESDSKWIDITKYPYTKFAFSIRFKSDGTYYGEGYFGDGGGTYKAIDNTIYTYIDGEQYAEYLIKSLTNNNAELTMTMGTSSIKIRAKKK